MPNLAQITIQGHVGQDAELKTTKSTGKEYMQFSVAVNNNRKNNEGKWETVSTDWYTVFSWDNIDAIASNVVKGAAVNVIGRPSVNAYIARDGKARGGLQITAKSVSVICQDRKEGGYSGQEPPDEPGGDGGNDACIPF